MITEPNPQRDAALAYARRGWSVLPVRRDKKPYQSWERWQNERADETTIRTWWEQWPDANVGIVTGSISGIVVVDVEAGGSTEGLPPTTLVRTGGGGWHYYYRYPGHVVKNAARIREKTDVRGDGGYVVAPPSTHQLGGSYRWIYPPDTIEFAPLPEWIIQKKYANTGIARRELHEIIRGVPEGERNNDATIIVGKLLGNFPKKDWGMAWELTRGWNERNQPPLPDSELASVFESIAERETEARAGSTRSLAIVRVKDILETEYGDAQWLVDKLIPQQGLTALSGDPGVAKTWLTMELARCVALGESFLGEFETRRGRALIVDEENIPRYVQRRIRLLHIPSDAEMHYVLGAGFRADNPQSVSTLLAACRDRGIDLVIFDSLIRIHERDENDARQMAQVIRGLQEFVKAGMAVVFTHHNRKQQAFRPASSSQNMRGSSDLLAAVDCHLAVSRSPNGLIKIEQTKMRHAEAIPPLSVAMAISEDSARFRIAEHHHAADDATDDAAKAIVVILEKNQSPMGRKELHVNLRSRGHARNAIERALNLLRASRQIEFVPPAELPPNRRQAHVYRLSSQSPDSLKDQDSGTSVQ